MFWHLYLPIAGHTANVFLFLGLGGVVGFLSGFFVGLPALLSGLARRHGGVYGLLAVAVAAVVGYLTGLVFKRTRLGRPQRIRVEPTADRNTGG